MFAYCGNCPVMYVDDKGNLPNFFTRQTDSGSRLNIDGAEAKEIFEANKDTIMAYVNSVVDFNDIIMIDIYKVHDIVVEEESSWHEFLIIAGNTIVHTALYATISAFLISNPIVLPTMAATIKFFLGDVFLLGAISAIDEHRDADLSAGVYTKYNVYVRVISEAYGETVTKDIILSFRLQHSALSDTLLNFIGISEYYNIKY